jgi:hypothetical protein
MGELDFVSGGVNRIVGTSVWSEFPRIDSGEKDSIVTFALERSLAHLCPDSYTFLFFSLPFLLPFLFFFTFSHAPLLFMPLRIAVYARRTQCIWI